MPGVGAYMGLGYGGAIYQKDSSSANADAMMQQYARQCSGNRDDGSPIVTKPRASNFIRPSRAPESEAPVAPYVAPPLRNLPPSQMFHKRFQHPRNDFLPRPSLPMGTPSPPSVRRIKDHPTASTVPETPPYGLSNISSSNGPSTPMIPKAEVDAARNRAMEVVERFKQQQQADLDRIDSSELGRKRKACFEQFAERLRVAMLKNLEYVARVEDQRLQKKLALAQQAEEYHTQMEDYHNQLMEKRSQVLRTMKQNSNNNGTMSQAGIGTQQREKQEKKRKQQNSANDSAALYISNLPQDGSATDDLMKALFGSYGSLRKVHFYIDKETGILKGDALVIYNIDDIAEKSNLIDTVCMQMNGAELPCGTALKVEPSDPLYALRKKKQEASQYGPAGTTADDVLEQYQEPEEKSHPLNGKEESKSSQGKLVSEEDVGEEDDGLDDFFASL